MVRTKNTVNREGTGGRERAQAVLSLLRKTAGITIYTQDVGGSSPSPPTTPLRTVWGHANVGWPQTSIQRSAQLY